MKVKKEEAELIVQDEHNDYVTISGDMVGTSRWTIKYYKIVKCLSTKKHYKVFYQKGATECQEDTELFYGDEVDFTEVELKEVVVKQWVPITE